MTRRPNDFSIGSSYNKIADNCSSWCWLRRKQQRHALDVLTLNLASLTPPESRERFIFGNTGGFECRAVAFAAACLPTGPTPLTSGYVCGCVFVLNCSRASPVRSFGGAAPAAIDAQGRGGRVHPARNSLEKCISSSKVSDSRTQRCRRQQLTLRRSLRTSAY